MKNYKIADLYIQMNCQYDIMKRRSKKYEYLDDCQPDFQLLIPEQIYINPPKRYQHLSNEEIELILMCAQFSKKLLKYQSFSLHASAIEYQQKAILFSADSGTGKSTHTRLWQSYYGKENVHIMNDDKPTIRFIKDSFYVYGTPFSGNSEENMDIKAPLHAIVFLKRSETNSIEQITPTEALPLLMKQTLRPFSSIEFTDSLLSLLDQLLKKTPIYILHCNMDESVVPLVKNFLFK